MSQRARDHHVAFGLSLDVPRPPKCDLTRTPDAVLFMWLGLFTVSWDRFAQVQIAEFNLKLSTIAYFLAFVLTELGTLRAAPRHPNAARPRLPATLRLVLVMAAILTCSAALATDRRTAALQV